MAKKESERLEFVCRFYKVLVTSLVVFAVGSNAGDDNNPHILSFDREIPHPKHREDKKNSSDDATQKRSKRFLFISDRNTILYNFNYRRGLVGASDMNYLYYDTALEADLSNWTSRCDFDAEFYSNYRCFLMSSAYSSYRSYANDIQLTFERATAFYAATSIYVSRVAGSVDYCPTLTANGTKYRNVYLRAYGLLSQSHLFNDTVRQYTPGPACTRCQSSVSWCYDNLCRDDCAMSIYGCCQISNGRKTEVCATTPTTTTTTTTTTTPGTTRTANHNNYYYYSGAPRIEAIGTVILYGLLLVLCHHFQ